MNFLAHFYLSFEDEECIIGNFIGDFVRGNQKNNYPDNIRTGIELHRQIDSFTDQHLQTEIGRKRLHPTQHKYSGVVLDIFYDHFLAANFSKYSDEPLQQYSHRIYHILQKYYELLPEEVHGFLPFMIERNWLLNYATLDGIDRALKGMSRRVSFANNMHLALNDLQRDYEMLQHEFDLFFPELISFVKSKNVS